MGHRHSKAKDPREEIEDMVFEMKMNSKMFANAAVRARKAQEKEINKARTVPIDLEYILTLY